MTMTEMILFGAQILNFGGLFAYAVVCFVSDVIFNG